MTFYCYLESFEREDAKWCTFRFSTLDPIVLKYNCMAPLLEQCGVDLRPFYHDNYGRVLKLLIRHGILFAFCEEDPDQPVGIATSDDNWMRFLSDYGELVNSLDELESGEEYISMFD